MAVSDPEMSTTSIKLFIIDTGPLITLALAESLDYLLIPDAQIIIPDAVFYEATRDISKLGAQEIIDWIKSNFERIELAATQTYINYSALLTVNPGAREAGLGERAAVEVIDEPGRLTGEQRAILLCEETNVLRRIIVRERDRIVELSTLDFLKELESHGRINSAAETFNRAFIKGRKVSRAEHLPNHAPELRDAVHEILTLKPKT